MDDRPLPDHDHADRTTQQSGDQTWGALLRAHKEEVLDRWTAGAVADLGGRMTPGELRRDVEEIYDGLLGELSRTRARQGFTPTETAIGVYALKDAVLDILGEHGDLAGYRAFARLSRVVDDLGMFMLETYAATRESVIAEQAETLLEL